MTKEEPKSSATVDLGGLEVDLYLGDLTCGEWDELNEATSFRQIADWLLAHTSLTEEQRRARPASILVGLKQRLIDAVWEGLAPPK
jgi:hypothetical protein